MPQDDATSDAGLQDIRKYIDDLMGSDPGGDLSDHSPQISRMRPQTRGKKWGVGRVWKKLYERVLGRPTATQALR